MPKYKFYCPDHADQIKEIMAKPSDVINLSCDLCGSKMIKNIGNVGLTKIYEMTDRSTAKKTELDFVKKAEKRRDDHFVNQEIHEVIDADRGTMDRNAAIEHKVFTKEGGRWRVRRKEDLK